MNKAVTQHRVTLQRTLERLKREIAEKKSGQEWADQHGRSYTARTRAVVAMDIHLLEQEVKGLEEVLAAEPITTPYVVEGA